MKMKKRNYKLLQNMMYFLLVAVLLCGCGNSKEAPTGEVQEVAAEENVTEELEKEEQEALQTVEGKSLEGENNEEVDTLLTVEEWLDSLNSDEVFFTIWNDTTKTGTILKQGERYEMQPGDSIYLHSTDVIMSVESDNIFITPVGKIGEHIPFEFTGNLPEEISASMIFETEDGKKYEVNNTFYGECIATAGTSENHELTGGRAWARSLECSEPKLLVWNDDTGMQKELQNNEECKFQQGDVIAILYPEGYTPFEVFPEEMFRAFLPGDGYVVIDYNPVESGETIEFKVVLFTSDYQKVDVNCNLIIE